MKIPTFALPIAIVLLANLGATAQTPELLHQFDGLSELGYLGWSVAGAGDVDGDGQADVIVGAYTDPGGPSEAGSACVYSGSDGSLIWEFGGVGASDMPGISVAGAGDVNADGRADVIVGLHGARPGGLTGAGSAYLYSGLDGSLLWQFDGVATDDLLGWSVAGVGDVNDDGRADVIVGAPSADPGGRFNAGSAFVYSGSDGSLLWQFDGAADFDLLGTSVAGAGDVDNDGRPDLIVGATHADPDGLNNAGSAYLYSGLDGSLLRQFNGAAADNRLGISVAGAGDVNDDGRAEVIVGAQGADPGGRSNAGSAFVYAVNGSLLWQFHGAAADDLLGTSVAGAGDVDNDGRPDLIVGAYGADPDARTGAGSALVYSGSDGSLIWTLDGAADGDGLGYSAAGAGDVNSDGRADLIVGAFGADPGGVMWAGSAYVYTSPCFSPTPDFRPGHRLVGTIADANDTDDFSFYATAGSKLTFVARPKGKGNTLIPSFTVIEPGGTELAESTAKGKTASVKQLEVQTTGLHVVSVIGSGGSTGDYVVKTKAKVSGKVMEIVEVGVSGGFLLLDGIPGMTVKRLSVKALAPKGDFAAVDGMPADLLPVVTALIDPCQDPAALAPLKTSKSGKATSGKNVATLTHAGPHRLTIEGGASVGFAKVVARLKVAKGKGEVNEK